MPSPKIFTIPDEFENYNDGFLIVAPLSASTRQAIHKLQGRLAGSLPPNSLWLPHGEQLHITFAHIISPDESSVYEGSRKALFQKLKSQAMQALAEAIPTNLAVELQPETIEAFEPAIIIKWKDDGTYDKLRQRFAQLFPIPEPTRRPPKIIHTTIARFRRAIDFYDVQKAVSELSVLGLKDCTIQMQVVHEQKIFLQQHEVLASFPS